MRIKSLKRLKKLLTGKKLPTRLLNSNKNVRMKLELQEKQKKRNALKKPTIIRKKKRRNLNDAMTQISP
jgi:hypothetical protein